MGGFFSGHKAALAGSLIGLLLGGPGGLLAGLVAGWAMDRMRRDLHGAASRERREIVASSGSASDGEFPESLHDAAFSVGAVVLAAKLAKADGRVTRDEIAVFHQVFFVPPQEMDAVGALFDRARQSPVGYRPYATQLARLFSGEPALLQDLLRGLVRIAAADGAISARERLFLRVCARRFGVSAAQLETFLRESGSGSGGTH